MLLSERENAQLGILRGHITRDLKAKGFYERAVWEIAVALEGDSPWIGITVAPKGAHEPAVTDMQFAMLRSTRAVYYVRHGEVDEEPMLTESV